MFLFTDFSSQIYMHNQEHRLLEKVNLFELIIQLSSHIQALDVLKPVDHNLQGHPKYCHADLHKHKISDEFIT